GEAAADVKMPAMLKQDQPVQVLAAALDYDGGTALAVYRGAARLFQGDTSIKGETITIDNKAGNLAASGGVTTTTVLETSTSTRSTKDARDAEANDVDGAKDVKEPKTKDRTPSVATARDLKYEDATRRLTYTGT